MHSYRIVASAALCTTARPGSTTLAIPPGISRRSEAPRGSETYASARRAGSYRHCTDIAISSLRPSDDRAYSGGGSSGSEPHASVCTVAGTNMNEWKSPSQCNPDSVAASLPMVRVSAS